MIEMIEKQRAMVAKHIHDENIHDWAAVEATFTAGQEAFFDAVPLSAHLTGTQGVMQAYQMLSGAVPDMAIRVNRSYDVPGCSIREVTLSGTHLGGYCGIPASGRKVTVEVACFFLFQVEGGKVELLAERVYFDNDTLFKQMRGDASAPTGIGLAPE
jgi:steroid delta-isomerase-like uncharacterized protein